MVNLFSQRVGIVATNNPEYVEAMLSCIEAGNIAVPLININDQYRINAANIIQVVTPTADEPWMRRKFTPANTNEIALISFTSGTEENPKGVILTHHNLAEVVTRLNSVMQLDENISEYIGVPVYHSFGFGRCRAVATAGGKFFIPSNGFNPSEIRKMLKRGDINAISAVPSLWRILLANKDFIGSYGRKVRWIEIGSQYMSRQEKEQMKVLFPEARIVQHYGLTEASRTTLLQIHEVEGDLLESVGQPLEGVEVKQTPEGQIAIRGDHIALSYLIDGQEIPLRDEDGWFLTKDLGSIENGYLYYQGRADDVINCGGFKVSPEVLETKIYARIGYTSGLAICRKRDLMRGEGFLVVVTKELNVDKQQLREAVLQATQELKVNSGNAITIIDVDSLPKTATDKIQRKQLAQWYAQEFPDEEQSGESTDTTSADSSPIADIFRQTLNISEVKPQDTFISLGGDSLSYIQFSMQLENYLKKIPKAWENMTLDELECLISPSPIVDIFRQTLNINEVKPQDTFISLGGDSLSYIQVSMQLENYLKKIPKAWENMTLDELDRLVPQENRNTTIETDIFFRAIAICAIVAIHSRLIAKEYLFGGAMLLLIISGINFAKFQGYKLLDGKVFQFYPSLIKSLVIPYLALNLVYQIWKKEVNFYILLMVDNFINWEAEKVDYLPFPHWFIAVIVQLIIIFSLIFAIKPLRNLAKLSPWRCGLILMIAGVLISKLSIHWFYRDVFFYPRVAPVLFWLFALGFCIQFAQSRIEKMLTTIIFIIIMSIMFINRISSENLWILIGGLMLVWIPSISVPPILKSILTTIAAASYVIYMTHFIIIGLLFKLEITNPWITILAALSGSLLTWRLIQGLPKFKFLARH